MELLNFLDSSQLRVLFIAFSQTLNLCITTFHGIIWFIGIKLPIIIVVTIHMKFGGSLTRIITT